MVRIELQALCAAFVCAAIAFAPLNARAADDPAKGQPPKPGPTGLTVKDFAAPPSLSMPELSPGGKRLAVVRRVGDLDQVLRIDLPSMNMKVIYQTVAVTPQLAKLGWRRHISFMAWKTDDTLVISDSMPVFVPTRYGSDPYEEPVHFVLQADGKSQPAMVGGIVEHGRAQVQLSYIISALRDDPDHILVEAWPALSSIEVQKVDIHTGKTEIVERGDENVSGYGADLKGDLVTRVIAHDGWWTLDGRAPGERTWTKIFDYHKKEQREFDKYQLLGTGKLGTLYVLTAHGESVDDDTRAVHSFDLKSMKLGPAVWSNATFDVDGIIQREADHEILGGCYWADAYKCEFTDAKLATNFKGLSKFFGAQRSVTIVSQSWDDARWVLGVTGPDEPGSYYVYDVVSHHVDFLGDRRPKLPPEALASMRKLDFKTRDGVALFAYVTEPKSPNGRLLPLIVMPHGGPEARDTLSYDNLGQFLASRGYVVLQPNFRGSGGFGRKFAEAGWREWGGRMHNDVMDATRALIAEGKVDPSRVCIVGASYGGYEAMYSAATEPATFKCAISIDGVSDLVGAEKFEREAGKDTSAYQYWRKSEGDPAKDSAMLLAHSPYRLATTWITPILLIHGDKDEVVPIEESRQMKRALEGAGKKVQYLEVKDMGHGPETEEEVTKVYNAIDVFLAPYLGDQVGAAAAH
jgi:dienelactone hydrolase